MSESYGQVPELGKRENGGERESYGTRWHELFGTPERAARTLAKACGARFEHEHSTSMNYCRNCGAESIQ